MAILSFSNGGNFFNILNSISDIERKKSVSISKLSSGKRINSASDSVSESAILSLGRW